MPRLTSSRYSDWLPSLAGRGDRAVNPVQCEDEPVLDSALSKALGEELRRAREMAGISRAELVNRTPSEINVRTYATYEYGTRLCTVARFIEICAALEVSAPEILELALQRAKIHLRTIGLQVDLRALLRDRSTELTPLRGWAENRLATYPEDSGIARLTASVLQELAICFGLSKLDLINYLIMFTPQSATRRQHASAN
jgi:transcriptional regulator with XRE-family HTH domain